MTSQSMWKYCPATFNPADLITRGMDAKAFISNQQYWNQGPSWLMKQTQEWPSVTETKLQDSTENYTESQSLSDNLASPQKSTNLLNAIDITKYSTLNKTLWVTALVIHFTTKLREKTKSNTVTAIDMKHAHIILLQSVQQFYYGDILSQIKDKAKGKQPAIITPAWRLFRCWWLDTTSSKTTISTTTTQHQVSNIDTKGESLVNPYC